MIEFGERYAEELDALAKAIIARENAEQAEKKARRDIWIALKTSGLKAFKGENIRVRITSARDRVTLDLKKLQAEDSDLCANLVDTYPKWIHTKETIWAKLMGKYSHD